MIPPKDRAQQPYVGNPPPRQAMLIQVHHETPQRGGDSMAPVGGVRLHGSICSMRDHTTLGVPSKRQQHHQVQTDRLQPRSGNPSPRGHSLSCIPVLADLQGRETSTIQGRRLRVAIHVDRGQAEPTRILLGMGRNLALPTVQRVLGKPRHPVHRGESWM